MMAGHRWSGWPGAWCLDCGVEWESPESSRDDNDPKVYEPCPCPNSGSHDPYRNPTKPTDTGAHKGGK